MHHRSLRSVFKELLEGSLEPLGHEGAPAKLLSTKDTPKAEVPTPPNLPRHAR